MRPHVKPLALLLATTSLAAAQTPMTASTATSASTAEQSRLCPAGVGYPTPWVWDPTMTNRAPTDATSGTPRIDQVRGGKVIATYQYFANSPHCNYNGATAANPGVSTGCGPFSRVHATELKMPGDVFNVYPAVYANTATEDDQEPYIGPVYNGTNPANITINGIVQGNKRPVLMLNTGGPGYNNLNQAVLYIDGSTGTTIKNINVACSGTASVANQAGAVFNASGTNVTFSEMTVHDCGVTASNPLGGNGIITGDGGVAGYFRLNRVEISHNGGPGTSGNRHNVYVGSSNVTAIFNHVWSHDAAYGHEIKSRAWRTVVQNSYLEGATGSNMSQAEAYLVDVPNGGALTSTGNIYVKAYSGANSNGLSQTYAMEGVPDARPMSIDIENDTFVALAKTFDGTHQLVPMGFYYPAQMPGAQGFPVPSSKVTVKNNAFAGYCPTGNPAQDYRGTMALTVALSEIKPDYSLAASAKFTAAPTMMVGQMEYAHEARPGAARVAATVGARD